MKHIYIVLIVLIFIGNKSFAQLSVVNRKGTIISVDSSKWTLSGTDIFNKNTGNVGIGNSLPTYKLDLTGKLRVTDSFVSNTARIITLNSGTAGDSIVTVDPSSGVLKRRSFSNLLQANNGISKSGDTTQLGGSLTKATIITTSATNTLAIQNLQSGVAADSIVTIDNSTGVLKRRSFPNLLQASNGLTRINDSTQLGGSLTKATNITTTSTNTLAISGLQSGTINDSVVMLIPSTNALRRVSPNTIVREPWNKIGGTTPSTLNSDSVYVIGNVSIGRSTNNAKLDVAGTIRADSTIAAPNYTSTIQSTATGSAYTWNLNNGANTVWTLAAGTNTLTINNAKAGMYGLIRLVNSGTSTLTFASGATANKVINGGGGVALLTQTASAVDILTFFYDGSVFWWTIGNNYN